MSEQKEITTQDVRKEMRGLDPITRKNLMSFVQNQTPAQMLSFVKRYKKGKGLDTKEGMEDYSDNRAGGCKGCKKKDKK